MYLQTENRVRIEISDNGDGIPDEFKFSESTSFGMKIIHSIIESRLGGKVEMLNSDGLQWKLEFMV